ncbi:SpoVA/SpoVAEb family sporulation membrane protein [Pasteuria penetrans]|uniref:SpoVA/SpoVAEb family sporulation membrane protein n=1 Tax=Pasteuria penetrans TaxID=86005 RepID=UPI000F9F24E7|nr:SpoVA/SpoVAEb family sporulation membrane protein [Pasteuria penetrans]
MSFPLIPHTSDRERKFKDYKSMVEKFVPKEKVVIRILRAFFVGGGVALLSHGVTQFSVFLGFSTGMARNIALLFLIGLSCLLTGLGKFDDFSQWAGAGLAVPITGFANSVASSALEHRTEGWVLGVAGNMFRLAGAIVVFGVVAACTIGIIHWVLWQIY